MSPRYPYHIEWTRKLPTSQMVYPEEFTHRIKYYFWRVYAPYHPTVRDSVIALNVVKNYGRQEFLLGNIAPHLSVEEFVGFLVSKGYAYHRVAWEDEGEIASLRFVNDFIFQYHIRVFGDREVRGHYEHTPESYSLRHLFEFGKEERREEFLTLMGDTIVPATEKGETYRLEFLPLLRPSHWM